MGLPWLREEEKKPYAPVAQGRREIKNPTHKGYSVCLAKTKVMLVEVLLLKWSFNKKQVAWGHDLPSAERIGIWFYRNNFSN